MKCEPSRLGGPFAADRNAPAVAANAESMHAAEHSAMLERVMARHLLGAILELRKLS